MTPMYATNPLAEIAGEAAEAVRALNHRTLMRDSIAQPSEVYQLLGELYTLAGGLPPHAVGDEEEASSEIDEGAVFVILPEISGDAFHSPAKRMGRRLKRLLDRLRLEHRFPQGT